MAEYKFLDPRYPESFNHSDYLGNLLELAGAALEQISNLGVLNLIENFNIMEFIKNSNFKKRFYGLRNPHSVWIYADLNPVVNFKRTSVEVDVFKKYIDVFKLINEKNIYWFFDIVEGISTELRGEKSLIRSNYNVISKPNINGDYWKFIGHKDVNSNLVRLYNFSLGAWNGDRVYLASVLIGAFISIHPMRDSNGRTGRVLFNLVLNKAIGNGKFFYIPLKEMMQLSGYGFEMTMREANVTGRWGPLIAYFCRVILLVRDMLFFPREINSSDCEYSLRGI